MTRLLNLFASHERRQVCFDDNEFNFFILREVETPCLFELLDRVLALICRVSNDDQRLLVREKTIVGSRNPFGERWQLAD